MGEEKLYRLRDFAKLMGISRSGVIKWIKQGKIRAVEIHGRWYIPESEIEKLTKGEYADVKRVAIYARVSGNTQKDDLERQITSLEDYVKEQFPRADYVIIKDIASGLKEDRKGLKKLIDLARRKQIDVAVVAFKDRLTRFGFSYLEELFKAYGVKVITTFNEEPKDYMQELTEDLIEIVTSFAEKMYGKSSHKYEKVVESIQNAIKDP